jgi:Tol biopolymer transport system component
MSSLPESLTHFRTDLENAIGLELARQRKGGHRRRVLAVIAAGLVVTVVSASAFGTVRDFLFGAPRSVTWGTPVWSPDGRRIAFLSTTCLPGRPPLCEGRSKIVIESLDGSARQELGHAAQQSGHLWALSPPVLSPDWRRVALVRDRGLYHTYRDGTQRHYSEIVVTNVDGSRRRIVARRGLYEDPVWSPDGTKIAFVRIRGGNADLCVVNADGTGRRKLAHVSSFLPNLVSLQPVGIPNPNANPAWSPDGRKIAFTSSRVGNEDIYVVDVDGGGLVNLTRSRGTDRRPVWSPDGRQIAYRGDRDGNGEVYVMNADGSAQRRLTRNPAPDNGAVWSPDGRRILFQRALGDIWVMNRDGSAQRNLTPEVRPARFSEDSSPAWSPDGRLIAFVTRRDGNPKVYVMTANGRDQAELGTFVDEYFARGGISRSAGGVGFSLSVPKTTPSWENGPGGRVFGGHSIRNFLIRRSLVRGQAAEVMIYWAALPGGGQAAAPCAELLSPALARSSIDDVASAVAKAQGTELVAGPNHVTLGGRPAAYVEVVVREDRGCDRGYFFTWRDQNWGALWGGTEPGDRIRVWIVDADGRRLFFVGETKEGFNHPLRPPPSKRQLQRVEREITGIVHSIRFD